MGFQNIKTLSSNFKETTRTNHYDKTPGLHYLHPGYRILDPNGDVYNFSDQSDQAAAQAASQEQFCVTDEGAPTFRDEEGFISNLKGQLDFVVKLKRDNMDPDTDYPKLAMLTRLYLFHSGDMDRNTLSSFATLFTSKKVEERKMVPNDIKVFNELKQALTLFSTDQISRELASHQVTTGQSTEQVVALQTEVEELTQSVEDGERLLSLKEQEYSELAKSKKDLDLNLEKAQQDLQTAVDERSSLLKQIDELLGHVDEHKQKHEDLNSTHEDLTGEKARLEAEVEGLKSLIHELQEQVYGYEEAIVTNAEKLENQAKQILMAADDKQSLNRSISQLREKLSAAESERDSKITELEKTSQTLSQFKRESIDLASASSRELGQYKSELEQKKNDFDKLLKQFDEVSYSKTELEAKHTKLEEEIEESKEDFSALQSQLEVKEADLLQSQTDLTSIQQLSGEKTIELQELQASSSRLKQEYTTEIAALDDQLSSSQVEMEKLHLALVQSKSEFKEEQLRSATRQAQTVVSQTGSSVDDDIYVSNIKSFHTSDEGQSMIDVLKSRYISVFNERFLKLNDPKVLFDLYDQSLKGAFAAEFGVDVIQAIEGEFDSVFTEEYIVELADQQIELLSNNDDENRFANSKLSYALTYKILEAEKDADLSTFKEVIIADIRGRKDLFKSQYVTKELIKHDYNRQLDAVQVLHGVEFTECTTLNPESAEYTNAQRKLDSLIKSINDLKRKIDRLDVDLSEDSNELQRSYTSYHLAPFADVNEDDISDKMYYELLVGYRQLSLMISSNMHKDIMGLHEGYLLSIATPNSDIQHIKAKGEEVVKVARKEALTIIQTENPIKKYHDLIKEKEVVEENLKIEKERLATKLHIAETDQRFKQASEFLIELKSDGVEDKDSQKSMFDDTGLDDFYRYARIEANFDSKKQDLKDHVEVYADAIKSYNDFVSKGEVVKSIADIYDYDVDHSKAVYLAASIIESTKGNLDNLILLTLALKESTFLLKSEQLDEFFKGTDIKSNAQLKESFFKENYQTITRNTLGGDNSILKVKNKMRLIGSEFKKYKEKFGKDFRDQLDAQGKLDQLGNLKLLEVFSLVRNFLEDHLDQNELTQEQKTKLSYSTDQLKVRYPNGVLYDQDDILSSSLKFNPDVDLREYVTQVLESLRVKHENVKQKHTKEAETLKRIRSSEARSPIREAATSFLGLGLNGLEKELGDDELSSRSSTASEDDLEGSYSSSEGQRILPVDIDTLRENHVDKKNSLSRSSSDDLSFTIDDVASSLEFDHGKTYPDGNEKILEVGEKGNPLQTRQQGTMRNMVDSVANFTGLVGTLPPPPRRNEEGNSDVIPQSIYGGVGSGSRFGTPVVTNQPQSTGGSPRAGGNMTKVQKIAAKFNGTPNGDQSEDLGRI